ncbi:MAG: hypothetical protein ACYSTZ_05075, partial [Planctomycetota bacterium]
DEQRADTMAAYGNTKIRVPNLSKLASESFVFKGDKNQLFNLSKDPGETTNLFDSGRHEDVIERLTRRIHEWQKKTKDTIEL